uniref:Uncharacterized protein n=1 Tax=Cucumis sativus TaxID=3659 RepID=A0A0A0KAA9_CUCSA
MIHTLTEKISTKADQVPETPRTSPNTRMPMSKHHPLISNSCLKTKKWKRAGKTNANAQHTALPTKDKKSAKFGTNSATKLTKKTSSHLSQRQYLPPQNRLSTIS